MQKVCCQCYDVESECHFLSNLIGCSFSTQSLSTEEEWAPNQHPGNREREREQAVSSPWLPRCLRAKLAQVGTYVSHVSNAINNQIPSKTHQKPVVCEHGPIGSTSRDPSLALCQAVTILGKSWLVEIGRKLNEYFAIWTPRIYKLCAFRCIWFILVGKHGVWAPHFPVFQKHIHNQST